MTLEDLLRIDGIKLDKSVHYSVFLSETDSNMFDLTLNLGKGAYRITLPVHITKIGNALRTLARAECVADCIVY